MALRRSFGQLSGLSCTDNLDEPRPTYKLSRCGFRKGINRCAARNSHGLP